MPRATFAINIKQLNFIVKQIKMVLIRFKPFQAFCTIYPLKIKDYICFINGSLIRFNINQYK